VYERFIEGEEDPTRRTGKILKDCLDVVHSFNIHQQNARMVDILFDPLVWSDRVLKATTSKYPPALVLLGLYGILLQTLRPSWWFEGAGEIFIRTILGEKLPPEWQMLMTQACKNIRI